MKKCNVHFFHLFRTKNISFDISNKFILKYYFVISTVYTGGRYVDCKHIWIAQCSQRGCPCNLQWYPLNLYLTNGRNEIINFQLEL